jgi:hypothetical protein
VSFFCLRFVADMYPVLCSPPVTETPDTRKKETLGDTKRDNGRHWETMGDIGRQWETQKETMGDIGRHTGDIGRQMGDNGRHWETWGHKKGDMEYSTRVLKKLKIDTWDSGRQKKRQWETLGDRRETLGGKRETLGDRKIDNGRHWETWRHKKGDIGLHMGDRRETLGDKGEMKKRQRGHTGLMCQDKQKTRHLMGESHIFLKRKGNRIRKLKIGDW